MKRIIVCMLLMLAPQVALGSAPVDAKLTRVTLESSRGAVLCVSLEDDGHLRLKLTVSGVEWPTPEESLRVDGNAQLSDMKLYNDFVRTDDGKVIPGFLIQLPVTRLSPDKSGRYEEWTLKLEYQAGRFVGRSFAKVE